MTTQYIDPINGDDTNDGSTEALAVKTFEQAALNSGFGIGGDTYDKQAINEETIQFFLLRGTNLLTKGFYIDNGAGSQYVTHVLFYGKNGAIINYVGNVSLFTANVSNQYGGRLYYDLRLSCLHLISSNTLNLLTATGNAMESGYSRIHNCSIKNFNLPSIPTQSIVTDAASLGGASYSTNQYDTTPTGYLKAKPTESAQGLGAFLPQPNEDWEYLPRAAIDFITQGWLDDSTYTDGRPIIAHSYIAIDTGTSCRVLGPVLEYPNGIDFTVHFLDSIEDNTLGADHNEVIDSTPNDAVRTIEVRSALVTFSQTDTSPTWITLEKNAVNSNVVGKFIQFRITLTSVGK